MNYLLLVVLCVGAIYPVGAMDDQPPEVHKYLQVNCGGCIIDLHRDGKKFEAYQLLKKFDHLRSDISSAHGQEGSLLHHCLLQGECRPYFIKTLLAKGAQLELTNGAGETPLLIALRAHNYRAAQMLIDAGAAATPVCNNFERTCLHWLCTNKPYFDELEVLYKSCQVFEPLLKLAKALIVPKVPLSLKALVAKKIACTPIDKIAIYNCIPELRVEVIFALLQYSKRFDLQYLSLITDKYTASLLIQRLERQAHPDEAVNKRDLEGNTPLHLAARLHVHPEFAFFLVSHGANRLIKNKANQTPLEIAQKATCNRNICQYCGALKEYLSQPQRVLEGINP